jgi:hypothetical protein
MAACAPEEAIEGILALAARAPINRTVHAITMYNICFLMV